MSDNKELEELKSIINSLIVPNPNGLSLRHLCNDYYEIEGLSLRLFVATDQLISSQGNRYRSRSSGSRV